MKKKSKFIGRDSNSNEYYYCEITDKRSVKYHKYEDPTTISALWYMWLHNKNVDVLENNFSWEVERKPNNTNSDEIFSPVNRLNSCFNNDSIYNFWNKSDVESE